MPSYVFDLVVVSGVPLIYTLIALRDVHRIKPCKGNWNHENGDEPMMSPVFASDNCWSLWRVGRMTLAMTIESGRRLQQLCHRGHRKRKGRLEWASDETVLVGGRPEHLSVERLWLEKWDCRYEVNCCSRQGWDGGFCRKKRCNGYGMGKQRDFTSGVLFYSAGPGGTSNCSRSGWGLSRGSERCESEKIPRCKQFVLTAFSLLLFVPAAL